MIIPKIQERLQSESALTAIVGDRVYSINLPKGEKFPAVVIEDDGREPDQRWDEEIPRFFRHDVEVKCFAESYNQVLEMGKICTDILPKMAYSRDDLQTRGITFNNENVIFEDVEDSGGTGFYIGSSRFTFIYHAE